MNEQDKKKLENRYPELRAIDVGREQGRKEVWDLLRKIKDRNRIEEFGFIVAQHIKDNTLEGEGR